MEFQYQNELNKNGLKYADLPEDAQTGIDQLKDISKALNMLEKAGKKPTAKTLKKIKAMDKWICYEIIDHVNETETNDDEIPHDDDEVLEELEEQVKEDMESHSEEIARNSKGAQVEAEIAALYEDKVTTIDIEKLKSVAPTCYNILFDTYDPEEENGLQTTNYSLIEGKDDDMFHVKKL
jgi:hypothetical protein